MRNKNKEENIGTGMHIEYLKPERVEEPNLVKPVIEKVFSTELAGNNWRKYTIPEMIDIVRDHIKQSGIDDNDIHVTLLLRKFNKCKTPESLIFALNEYLMGV